MVPSIEGEFARKRRMMSHALADRRARRPARPARLPAALRADDRSATALLRYAAPFLHLARASRGGPRAAADARAARSRPRSAPRQAPRPLLVARYYVLTPGVDRRRAVRLAAPRHRGRLGRSRRARGDPPRVRRRVAGDRARCSPRPSCSLAIVAIRLESKRPPDLPPAAHRQGRPSVRRAQAAHDGRGRRVDGLRPRRQRGRPAHHARRRAPAPLLDRRAAEPRQRPARRHGDHRPAPDGPGAGRRSTPSASAAASPSGPASPAGRRSTAARRCRGPSASSSTSGTSSTARCASTSRSSCAPPRWSSAARASTRARPAAGRSRVDCAMRSPQGSPAVRRDSSDEPTQHPAAGLVALVLAAAPPRRRRGDAAAGAYHETDAGSCTLNFAYSHGRTCSAPPRTASRASVSARATSRASSSARCRSSATRTDRTDFAFIRSTPRTSPRQRRRQGLARLPEGLDGPGRHGHRRPIQLSGYGLGYDTNKRRRSSARPSSPPTTVDLRGQRPDPLGRLRRTARPHPHRQGARHREPALRRRCAPRRARRSRASSPRPPRAATRHVDRLGRRTGARPGRAPSPRVPP